MRDHLADALIVAIATLDKEANILIISDTKILASKKLQDKVKAIRDERKFGKLKIIGLEGFL